MEKKQVIKSTNLDQTLKNFENKWVALSQDKKKVVSSGNTLNEALGKVSIKDRNKISVMRVLPFDVGYAPNVI